MNEKALKIAEEMKQKAYISFAKRMQGIIELREVESRKGSTVDQKMKAQIKQLFTESLDIFDGLKMMHEMAKSCLELARYYQWTGDTAEAQKFAARAKEIFQKLGAMGDLKKLKSLNISK